MQKWKNVLVIGLKELTNNKKDMKDLIDYLNQSGLTDLVRIYMVVGGILFIAVLAISIWIIVKISKRMFNDRDDAILDFYRRRKKREKEFD